ncbi:nitrite reductase small subunit NirD [Paenibacillus tuaregi]|uniref:nitrite reductase small subunit NirD n=1 Tax=Paenibacillus tuaregi TaxID=1816681 RepID=UPI0008387BDE|nr:nitrite reductase small subunit NirD [Paenibacillus tuaregi]
MKQETTFIPVGNVNDFPDRIGRTVVVGGKEIAIFLTSVGEMYAIDNRNPHPKGGPMAEGIVSGFYLYDPLYDWKIDLRTGLVQAPDQGQVQTYPVMVKDGIVYLAAAAQEAAGLLS